ncbi:hypothetical protein PIB30_105176 [Stylosanthes scabra]|uniref:Uncharacterized protein n=1 Tax=Stylosanthes scabra TaxID=79078 RepID=A0ABU6VZT0_9FABA|nr:hypothetical protein [Stylosanthes scabra]
MRLTDPTLSQRIKIQVQLIGATQDAAAEQATLHHQVLYRVQDHALDLKLPNSTGDALLMFHDKNHGPAIVNIPRMIITEELSSIVPLEWITNYEKAFPQQIPDVHTTAPPRITRASDGTITTVFQRPGSEGQRKSKKKKKQSCTVPRRSDPPDEPDYKPKFSLKRRSQKSYQNYSMANPQVVPCIATLGSYDHDFPPLQISADDTRVTRRPYVTPPQGVSPHGYQAITPQEEVLNWHTDNALNQNKVLNRIDHRLGTLEEKVDEASTQMSHLQAHIKELRDRLATQAIQLDHDLRTYIHEKTKPQTLTTDPLSLYPPPYPAYTPNLYPPPSSPPQSSDYGSIFQSFHSLARHAQPKTPISPPVQPTGFKPKEPKPRPRPPWKPEFREFFPGDPSGIDKGEKEEKSSDRTINFTAQNDSTFEEDSSTDYSEETSEEDHIADISAIAMVNPAGEDSDEGHVTDDEDHRQPRQTTPSLPSPDSSSSKSGNFYFTFDDIDPDNYRQRLNDFGAWKDTRMTIPGMTLPQVHTEFITRMTGNLREWMNGFSEYERMGLVNGTSENFLGLIHKEFLRDITIIQKRNSQEYYEMKCCSLNRRDLKIITRE